MPKSAAERNARRAIKKRAALRAANQGTTSTELGPHWDDKGIVNEQHKNNKLVGKSLRWLTEDADDSPYQVEQTLSHKEVAVRVTRRNMLQGDGAVSNSAVANLLRMESMNQKDEQADIQKPQTVNHNNLYLNVPADKLHEAMLALENLKQPTIIEGMVIEGD